MANNISFVGRVVRDAELHKAGNHDVLKVTIANSVGFGDRQSTNWFNCEIWGTRGAKMQQYLVKGKQVFVTGELTLRKFTKKDDSEGLSPDVKVGQLDLISSGQPAGDEQPSKSAETEDDLPF